MSLSATILIFITAISPVTLFLEFIECLDIHDPHLPDMAYT